MFQNFLWYLGKIFQLMGLVLGPYALYIGLTTQDARRELTWLVAAATEFLAGYLLVSYTESKK